MALNITNIPAPRVDFIDPRTGLMAREWYRFFLNLFTLVGSGTNETSLVDLQVGPTVQDISGEMIESQQEAQLMSLTGRYDALSSLVEGSYLSPAAIPQDISDQQSDSVLTWLSGT